VAVRGTEPEARVLRTVQNSGFDIKSVARKDHIKQET